MNTENELVIEPTKTGLTKVGEWLAIVLMNIWVPVLLLTVTLLGIVLFPFLLGSWKLVTKWSTGKIMRHFIKLYGRIWLWIIRPFVHVTYIEGKPDLFDRPSVIVVNHFSFFDTFFLAVVPIFDVIIYLRSWPFKMGFYAPFMRLAEYQDIEHLSWDRIVEKTEQFIREGRSVLLFPQGHRSRDGGISRFHSGAFKLACQLNVPIVPFCITGTDRLLPPGRRWLAPAHVCFKCLDVVESSDFSGDLGHIELRKHVKKMMEDHVVNRK
jgi:1-acyl-sn-glycerol-3-phosphate acyltransferase